MKTRARWIGAGTAVALWLLGVGSDCVRAQTIGGNVSSSSTWTENIGAPPGDGDHKGQLLVGVWNGTNSTLGGVPDSSVTVVPFTALPIAYGPYAFTFTNSFLPGDYQLVAWIDGNTNGAYDLGEPHVAAAVTIASGNPPPVNLNISDDSDGNGLPDWWEYHWFRFMLNPFGQAAAQDTDNDGLANSEEAGICTAGIGMDYINPANWDTDGDGMDDGWEFNHYSRAYATGLNPVVPNATTDYDGDGLSNWQEYGGIDGLPVKQSAGYVGGVHLAQATPGDTGDDLNPLDIDTDFDMLIDSYEAAWYDVGGGIDPHVGVMTQIPNGTNVNTSIARADPDQDGLSNYREQCLLADFHEGAANGDKWVWTTYVPFSFLAYQSDDGVNRRICTMTTPLALGLAPGTSIPVLANRNALRNHAWTDPTEGTGYAYTSENLPPGHDTDNDLLPDGWEVQFGLDPRDSGLTAGHWDNGPFGDPDNDGLENLDEYLGQDGNRFTTRPYINGTGDETNPNTVDHRPDSCYQWRWLPANILLSSLTNPRMGTGINRDETLGSSLPTRSLGKDLGWDTDDDGLSDAAEIHPGPGFSPTSPVHSCDPFHAWAVLVTNAAGIPIPDPEPAVATNFAPAGVREDLQRRDWTLECQVKLLGTNLVGDLFNFKTQYGPNSRTVWQLSLVQNVPVLSAHINGFLYSVSANALPTNKWVHLAGVWSHAANSLGLYLDGVLFTKTTVMGESASLLMMPATNALALGVSTNGSFVNRLLLDEVRIWGVARTAGQIAAFARDLVPPCDGDDVWLDAQSHQYYGEVDTVIVNGGSLFYGEPGTMLSNVCNSGGNYWIDNGDHQYNAANDVLMAADTSLVEGLAGSAIANVFWNDKDGDGVFSQNGLLAYYRFDDGGISAEDFARPAKNSLIGATREDLTYGDRGYALTTGFQWVTNDASPVYGVDLRGADDSDHDTLPDGWELVNHLDPWDNGTRNESTPGASDGPNGALGDPDQDGLVNQYEFWADTNPQASDSDDNGVPDAQEDRDGDSVDNVTEQALRSRPDMVDTDDDSLTDGEEVTLGTSPANPSDPPVSRSVAFGGSADDYLDVAPELDEGLAQWTLEAWVNPTNTTSAGAGTIVRRVVQDLTGGTHAVNYIMGLETNGAGGLRLYAGFVMASGVSFTLHAGSVPGGVWTHTAASYNPLTTTLTLYTNGVFAATTNTTQQVIPPVNGKGGDYYLRMGEDFGGMLDEVRLWGVVRTAKQIAGSYTTDISSTDASGLVHDFRFDDGQAVTNTLAFGPFHMPGGYQDFTVEDDWNMQWRHAAQSHGSTATAASGAIVLPPSLRVLLQPPEAVAAGAAWLIDNGTWQNSGDNLEGLTPGDHVVAYKSIPGWTEPASETVTLTNGLATTVTRQYFQDASISIGLQPAAAVAGGALWQVDAGGWLPTGSIVTNLAPGVHVIQFAPVAGYIAPASMTPTLNPGEAFQSNVKYQIVMGSLSATLTPPGAVADGALWHYVGGAWTNSDTVISNLPLGTYTVEFSPLSRWITPSSIPVVLNGPQTIVVTGVYSQVTGLSADIAPAAAIAAGAQWRVGSGNWINSGVVTQVAVGSYTVNFKPIVGWLSPASATVVVSSQQVAVVAGTYYSIATVGNGQGSGLGQFSAPCGLAVDARHRLFVVDTYNGIQVYDPVAQTWTQLGTAGSRNGSAGTFYQPGGVAVDARGNVYVADENNNRIQVWNAASGMWQILGGYGLSAAGQFNLPTHVAVDSSLALYVADYWNNRIQKMNTNGQWSVIVSNGTAAGYVTYPEGISVDGQNGLYVSDNGWTSNNLNRIQRFNSSGQFQNQVGGSGPDQGALSQMAGMALGATDLYVADLGSSSVFDLSLTNGVWTTLLGPDVVSNACDVAYDPRGMLYVADTGHGRVLALPVQPASVTNGVARAGAAALSGTNGFVVSWYGATGWLYAVQYAGSLVPVTNWRLLPGGSNIVGRNAVTNSVDGTAGVTNRFYRIMAY